jgi:formylglycine-generating enzyme required for sulfatase activity
MRKASDNPTCGFRLIALPGTEGHEIVQRRHAHPQRLRDSPGFSLDDKMRGKGRVVRGGSWLNGSLSQRAAVRDPNYDAYSYIGVHAARTLTPSCR